MPSAAQWTQEDIQRRISELGPWFHNINLHGVWTAPNHFLGNYPGYKWSLIAPAFPDDLTGKSVLDIGCNAGFFSIEMKKRGAARVVGIDSDERYLAQARFVAEVLSYDIDFRLASVYDVGALGEMFDVVLFMGVLYHLRHPLLALDLIHDNVAGDLLLFQSLQRESKEVEPVEPDYKFEQTDVFDSPGFPHLNFIENRFSGDPTNWWIPNRAAAEAMLRSSGFEILKHPAGDTYLCRRVELPLLPDGPRAVYPTKKSGEETKKA